MNMIDYIKQVEELSRELEMMQVAETEYAGHTEPSRSAFEQHAARMKRFQEMTKELSCLAEETAR